MTRVDLGIHVFVTYIHTNKRQGLADWQFSQDLMFTLPSIIGSLTKQ